MSYPLMASSIELEGPAPTGSQFPKSAMVPSSGNKGKATPILQAESEICFAFGPSRTVEVDEAATMLAQRYPVMAWGELKLP